MNNESYCYGCALGFHAECNNYLPYGDSDTYYVCCCWSEESAAQSEAFTPEVIHGPEGPFERRLKDDEDLKDQTSTGRKRAIKVVESLGRGADGSVCEWANLARAGGGAIPIIGCRGNIVRITKSGRELPPHNYPRNVHHGPDKSTTNNDPGNLHVICPNCHNRWHGLNDPHYPDRPDNGEAFLPEFSDNQPHDPVTLASEAQLIYSDTYWGLKASIRKNVPYTPPKE